MKTKKIITIVIWVILVIVVLFFMIKRTTVYKNFDQTRIYKDTLNLLNVEEINVLGGLLQLKKDKLYFVSWKDANIVKFDIESWSIEEIYGRKGRGPTENINISSFEIKENSYITYDQAKKSVQEVSIKDSLLYYHKILEPLSNSVKVDNYFLLSGTDSTNMRRKKFVKFDLRNSEIEEIEVKSDLLNEDYADLVYHGIFTKNKSYLAYVTTYNNNPLCIMI